MSNNNRYKYKSHEIAAMLKQNILERRLPADTSACTVRSLSAHYGISSVTADRAIRQLVQEDYLYRVPGKGTFVKNDPPKIFKIGIAAGDQSFSVSGYQGVKSNLMSNCLEYFHQYGYEPEILHYRELKDRESGRKKLAKLDGLLICCSYIDKYTLPLLKDYSGKIVIYRNEYILDDLLFSQIIPEFRYGYESMMKKFPFDQYSRIILLKAQHPNSDVNAEEFILFLKENGYPPEKLKIINVKVIAGDNGPLSAYQATRKYVAECRNTLIFSTSDYLSFGMISALQEANLEPGKDLDLISMDNVEGDMGIMPYEEPFLTVIDRQFQLINRSAVELLVELMRKNDNRQHIIKIPTKLIIRKSTRPFTRN